MCQPRGAMRVCLVYDCLFPHTVGGAERWYRNLAERLAADGHEVTYLTLRQWDAGAEPAIPGVDVRVLGPRMELYAGPGRRRVLPPLVFGAGVLWHLSATGDAMTSFTPPRFRTSRCWRRPPRAWPALPPRRRLARGVDADLLAGVSGPARRHGRLAGAARCARGSRNEPSASRVCTPRGCAMKA